MQSSTNNIQLEKYRSSVKERLSSVLLDEVKEGIRLAQELPSFNGVKSTKIKPKVLLVEDDKICQFAETRLLQAYGCQVDLAGSGEAALEMFNGSYDAIILDVDLPGMSGLEVSRAIRNTEQNKRTPIIGVTTQGEDMRSECLAAGYDDVMIKPADLRRLGKILSQFIDAKEPYFVNLQL